jgi:hypothetical protein
MKARHVAMALGAIAVAALVVILLSDRGSNKSEPAAKKDAPATKTPGDDSSLASNTRRGDRPTLRTPTARTKVVREEVRDDGTVVRDHRTGATGDVPKSERKVQPRVRMATAQIHRSRAAVAPLVRDCEQRYPVTLTGDRAKLNINLRITIENEKLTVTNALVRARGAESAADLIDCVKSGVERLEVPAQGHVPMPTYKLSMGFRLGRGK